jgi:hypothetical protein
MSIRLYERERGRERSKQKKYLFTHVELRNSLQSSAFLRLIKIRRNKGEKKKKKRQLKESNN